MLVFRSLDYDNVHLVAELERECFGEDAWSENLLREEIGQEDKYYFLLFLGEELVAYGGFSKVIDEGDIMNIAVSKKHRGRGYGRKILEKFFSIADELGIRSFTLEVRESNLPARRLYESKGFTFSGQRRNYYNNKEDCCIYWKIVAEES